MTPKTVFRHLRRQTKFALLRFLGRHRLQVYRGPGLVDFLHSRRIDVVLDVGANAGQFVEMIRGLGYRGRIVSFEPTSATCEVLNRKAAADPLWEVRHLALGAYTGTATLHVSEDTLFNSILSQRPAATQLSSRAAVVRTETVEMFRLDDIFHEFSNSRVFVKIDTQGYEQQVLTGASNCLEKVLGLQLELPLEYLYEGMWSIEEALSYMSKAGFVVAQVSGVNVLHDDSASHVELDCVFRRKLAVN